MRQDWLQPQPRKIEQSTHHMLRGRVESVAAGIGDRDRSAGTTLPANVNPTFNWARLAQRACY
jgi:multidrug resistance efflux pump